MPKGHNKSQTIEADYGYFISYLKVEDSWNDGTNGTCKVSTNKLDVNTNVLQVNVEGLAFRGINWKVEAY